MQIEHYPKEFLTIPEYLPGNLASKEKPAAGATTRVALSGQGGKAGKEGDHKGRPYR
jgi:hypothetical protein